MPSRIGWTSAMYSSSPRRSALESSGPQPVTTQLRATATAIPAQAARRSRATGPRHHPQHVSRDQRRAVDVDLVPAAEGDQALGPRVELGQVELAPLPRAVD